MQQRARNTATAAFVAGAIVIFLLSCSGGSESPTSTIQPTATPTETSAEPAPSPGVLVASTLQSVAFDFTPDGRIVLVERTKGEIWTKSLRLDAATAEAVNLARNEYAELAGAEISDVVLLSITARQWPDTCLGLGASGEVCGDAITPGYEITVAISGASGGAVYRTDTGTVARIEAIDSVAAATAGATTLFATVDTFVGSECGLLGIAVDPEFETNRYVYIYVTQPVEGDPLIGKPRVIRFTDVNRIGQDPTVIVGDLPTTNPNTCAHVGGNLHFGPDGYLYLSIGNNERTEDAVAADLSSPLGKILRMNKEDGSAAPDNPFIDDPEADPRVYAYGLRNAFDFAFHPTTGEIYAPDNGPGTCDELNLIKAGSYYGVPDSLPVQDTDSCFGLGGVDPIHLFAKPGMSPENFGSNMAPAGVAFLAAGLYPTLPEGMLICFFNGPVLRLLEFAPPDFDVVTRSTDIADCLFNVEVWEGKIYYATADGIYVLPPEALAP